MRTYPSVITFLYYDDLAYGQQFFTSVLQLEEVMNQGFAVIYKASPTSYIGIVRRTKSGHAGDTLISLNTNDVKTEHQRYQTLDVSDLTSIQRIDLIPLDSFFFADSGK